jgi:competence protein ComEC
VWARIPLVPVAVAFAAGIAAAEHVSPVAAWTLWAAALPAGAVLLARPPAGTLAALPLVPLLASAAALGCLRAAPAPVPAHHLGMLELPRAAVVEGSVAAEPVRWPPDRARLLLDVSHVDGVPRTGRAAVTVYGLAPPLGVGQRIVVDTRLHRPQGFRNPGTFDHGARLRREGVHAVGSARGERITTLDDPQPPWPARLRRRALATLQETLPPASAAILAGLLLGERTALPPEIDAAFRRAGTYHLLAVSGSNVALVAAAAWVVLRAVAASRRAAALGALAAVLVFAAVAGPDPSVLRATIMGVLVLAALVLERDARVVNSLALAAVAILAARPWDLHDPGFQLSFAATAGIVAAPLPRGLVRGALAVTLAAQAAVLPITLAHFNQLSTVAAVANLGAAPLAAAATVLGLTALGLHLVSTAAGTVVLDAAWPVLLLLRGVVAAAAAVPGAVVYLPAPGPLAVVCYLLAVAAARLAWSRRGLPRPRAWLLVGAAGGCAAVAVILTAWPAVRPADGWLRMIVLDVGQGDATVLQAPDGHVAVVDAGPGGPWRLDTGERVVAPFLWNRGTLRLAAAVTTHDDVDHAGGMPAVRARFAVAGSWSAAIDAREPIAFGGAVVTALRGRAEPARPGAGPRRDNAAAVVLRVEIGRIAMLLASDLDAEGEEALLREGVPLRAAVLKVAHHGARSSTTPAFLDAVRPAVAVVSVGSRNAFGHPDPGVLARLARAGATVYRTDVDGAVTLETDGRALAVTAWASGRRERHCLDPEALC